MKTIGPKPIASASSATSAIIYSNTKSKKGNFPIAFFAEFTFKFKDKLLCVLYIPTIILTTDGTSLATKAKTKPIIA